MILINIFEEKHYYFKELSEKFHMDSNGTKKIIVKLKRRGILRIVDKPYYVDYDKNYEINEYKFTFVGITIIEDLLIKCYPKYLKNNRNLQNEFKQVIKVLEKYNSGNEPINTYEDYTECYSENILQIIIYLIKDYYDNGIYSISHKIIETNGNGDILWNKTINDLYPIIKNNKPYYVDVFTNKTVDNSSNYFKLLHEVILTKCSRELESLGLLDLFDLNSIELSDKELDDFGENEYILYKIIQEINVQFNSHNQLLLKLMYIYISNKESSFIDNEYFRVYGTNSYNLVWEKMCSFVLDDKKDMLLKDLNLPKANYDDYYTEDKTLLDIIKKPIWVRKGIKYEVSGTLKPDTLTFNKVHDGLELIIFDAKYYDLEWEDSKIQGQPGIESITKQYLYELAYHEFANKFGIVDIQNYFVFPIDDDIFNENENKESYVELEILHNLDLKNIYILRLPASLVSKYYLENKKFDISKLLKENI